MKPERWELWWARVRYEDSDQSKRRPVLVVGEDEYYILSLKITSHAARDQWGEYEIVYWRTSGLPKPSTIRITQKLRLRETDFDGRIGKLHPFDVMQVQRYLD